MSEPDAAQMSEGLQHMSDSTFSGKPRYGPGDQDGKVCLPSNYMSDQEIRARALECAVRYPMVDLGMFWEFVSKFEAYIRDGHSVSKKA